MKYSHFYTVDQWDLRDVDLYWQGVSRKQMMHKPCNQVVNKATTGTRWVCIGCYTEPPDEILDVMLLADVWKGWDDPVDNKFKNLGTHYFYMNSSTASGSSISNNYSYFYTGFTVSGSGTYSV